MIVVAHVGGLPVEETIAQLIELVVFAARSDDEAGVVAGRASSGRRSRLPLRLRRRPP